MRGIKGGGGSVGMDIRTIVRVKRAVGEWWKVGGERRRGRDRKAELVSECRRLDDLCCSDRM